MKININTSIEIEVEVEGKIVKGTPDKWDSVLGGWLPGEQGGVDDLKVFLFNGKDFLEITKFLDSEVVEELERTLYEEKEHA